MSRGFLITIAIIVGLVVIPYFYMTYTERRDSKHWPSTQGKIIQVDLVPGSLPRGTPCYKVKVVYKYVVNGNVYTSTDRIIDIEPCFSNRADAVSVANRYLPEGKAVTVYYNPAHPLTALLERE